MINIPDKHLRRAIIISLFISTIFVIASAFDDLYHPGSESAKQYYNFATWGLTITILLSLPLWYKKVKAIEAWYEQYGNSDDKWKSAWLSIKPMIITIVWALILTAIAWAFIQYFDLVPKDAIANYIAHYKPQPTNLSNLTLWKP